MMNSKHNPMTGDQKQALRMMAERNIGAMVTRFGWTWPETVRNNDEAAGEVIRILSCKDGFPGWLAGAISTIVG